MNNKYIYGIPDGVFILAKPLLKRATIDIENNNNNKYIYGKRSGVFILAEPLLKSAIN